MLPEEFKDKKQNRDKNLRSRFLRRGGFVFYIEKSFFERGCLFRQGRFWPCLYYIIYFIDDIKLRCYYISKRIYRMHFYIRRRTTGGHHMFCIKCGKEISDQAQFCNYCGAPVNNFQQPAAPAAPRTIEITPPPAKKNSKKGGVIVKIIIPIVVFVVVFFLARFITEIFVSSTLDDNDANSSSSSSSGLIEVTTKPSLTDACMYGAVYEYGFLTYGLTEVYLSGYTLLPGESPNEPDALLSPDENFTFLCNKVIEIIDISYDASDENGILESFDASSNAYIIDFQKYYVGDYPVIRYIAKVDVYGEQRYFAELVVFPDEMAKETIRLQMYGYPEAGYDEINRVFDTLNIVPEEFAPSSEDTTAIGFNRITVK